MPRGQRCNWTITQNYVFGLICNDAFTGAHDKFLSTFTTLTWLSLASKERVNCIPSIGSSWILPLGAVCKFTKDCKIHSSDEINEGNGELLFSRYMFNRDIAVCGFDFTPSHTGRGNLAAAIQDNLNFNLKISMPLIQGAIGVVMLVWDNKQ